MEDEEEVEVNKRISNIQEPKLQPLLLILEPLIPIIAEISEKAAKLISSNSIQRLFLKDFIINYL
ncbi:hypothetical protein Anas_11198 [Armadillidium nasatum]|uniref:Uncharacterized protein n=1 Tax=Armadillidium nasatum TaxID=96803 RepID=A0A5N5TCL2_9CRUS|nr:hypothetical protein Anas_11198 [Armadillidium nasatum]